MAIWDYIHAFAPLSRPESATFYDHHDQTLYRDVSLHTIGEHGWELVSVLLGQDPKSGDQRYEYFFKRNRDDGYTDGIAPRPSN